jgi:hypothetical protein
MIKMHDNRGIFEAIIGDGRPLLLFTGLALVLSGSFAIFQAGTGHFLPHDVAFLGMDAQTLCQLHDCRIVNFMIHDRIAFGGALVSVGVLYMWLAEFPLRQRQAWAWWAYVLSGAIGFASFLGYLSYNYLDTWHGGATLLLFPCYLVGLIQSYRTIQPTALQAVLKQPKVAIISWTRIGVGYICLLLTALGLLGAGAVISVVGMTWIFVPQDLSYMALDVADLHAITPQLVPLIAHDRAGFGGALFSSGIAMSFCIWFGQPSRNLWQSLLISGSVGFGCAIGVHFAVGYLDTLHLLPAYLGIGVFLLGLLLTFHHMMNRSSAEEHAMAVSNS